MVLEQLLSEYRTHAQVRVGSKKKLLEFVGDFLAKDIGMGPEEIFTQLINRERLGSTGIGEGIAIPHCRLEKCTESVGALIQLADGIDFDAIDKRPVDLVFILVVPQNANETHIQLLGDLAKLLNQTEFCQNLRQAKTDQALYQAAVSYPS